MEIGIKELEAGIFARFWGVEVFIISKSICWYLRSLGEYGVSILLHTERFFSSFCLFH